MNSTWCGAAEGWKIKSNGCIYKFEELIGFGDGLKILVQVFYFSKKNPESNNRERNLLFLEFWREFYFFCQITSKKFRAFRTNRI